MRRTALLLVITCGVFLVVLGPLFRWFILPKLTLLPTNLYAVTTVQAENGSYFSIPRLKEIPGATVLGTVTVRGDTHASTGSTSVVDSFVWITGGAGKEPIGYIATRIPMDRKTGLARDCCGAYVGTDHKPSLSGLTYKWPYFPAKKTYTLYDQLVGATESMHFAGSTTLHGDKVYKYVGISPQTKTSDLTVPGTLLGLRGGKTVVAGKYAGDVSSYWVDAVTGAPVKVEENLSQTLVYGTSRLTLLSANLATPDKDVASNARKGKRDGGNLVLARTALPLFVSILGLVVAGLGLWRLLLPRRAARRPSRRKATQQSLA